MEHRGRTASFCHKSDDGEDVSFAFTIHKNILYYADSNKVHAYDLSDNEMKYALN